MVSAIYTTWTTYSRHSPSQMTGPNILRIRVVYFGGTFWLLVPSRRKVNPRLYLESELAWQHRYWTQSVSWHPSDNWNWTMEAVYSTVQKNVQQKPLFVWQNENLAYRPWKCALGGYLQLAVQRTPPQASCVSVAQLVYRDESRTEKVSLHRGKFKFMEAFWIRLPSETLQTSHR